MEDIAPIWLALDRLNKTETILTLNIKLSNGFELRARNGLVSWHTCYPSEMPHELQVVFHGPQAVKDAIYGYLDWKKQLRELKTMR